MKVLVACEFTGTVRDAFVSRGHDAWSCDLDGVDPEGIHADKHFFGDCRDIFHITDWDLIIAHPPCTYLCNSGVRWLYGGKGTVIDPVRWKLMEEGAAFFKEMLAAPAARVAVENPIMHGHAKK